MTSPNHKSVLLTLLFLVVSVELASATNFGFLPGDCFFHTTLSKEFIEQLQKENDPEFDYVRPKNASIAFCGYGGFYKMKFQKMPQGLKQNLNKVYQQIREQHHLQLTVYPELKWDNELQKSLKTGKIIREEVNPIHVFFVNADYDVARFKVGLKYNETWAEEMMAIASHKRDQTHLDLFVESGSAVMRDWRDAKLVRKLDVRCPELTTRNFKKPVEVTGKLKAIVLPTGEIKDYYHGGPTFYVVDAEKIQEMGGDGTDATQRKTLKGGLFQP